MPDYRLEALGTRSFEQLIQSLALAEVTPSLVPFGDGADGGREATFDGPTNLTSGSLTWSGYGVLQAKFRQRPLGTMHDAKWAIKELRSELAGFTKAGSTRRMPEYYIFATNATLSPGQGGSKDKLLGVLSRFAKTNKLKGFDVWDYDKLRVLIDKHEGVRSSYDAWITTGDVLAVAMRQIGGGPDFHSTMNRWLARELLDFQYARLEQAGAAGGGQVPLASVFVDVPVSDRPINDVDESATQIRLVSSLLAVGQERLDFASQANPETPRGRYVIIGGPGQGKTTVAQFICQLHRAALLLSQPPHSLAPEVKSALDVLETQRGVEQLPLPIARRFPVHIVLNELARYLAQAKPEEASVLHFISNRITRRLQQAVPVEHLRAWLGKYPWVVVFDGLDEVPASTNRNDLLKTIQEFTLDAHADNADLLVIATSRPQGYGDEFSPKYYQHMWLAPLTEDDALRYGERLIGVRYGLESNKGTELAEKLQRAVREESTKRLMQTPLQVTIMTHLIERIGKPPQERYSLFKDYYDVIYSRELERDIPAAEVLRSHRADIDSIHWRVGLALQARSESEGGTEATLTRAEFTGVAMDRLREEEHTGVHLEALLNSITEAAAQRLVFLVGHETDAIGFEIRSLQEFMAAEALHEGPETVVQGRLSGIAVSVHWRNVFLFAAGRCFSRAQALRDTVVLICQEAHMPGQAAPEHIELRSGASLAADLLDDGSCRKQPKYVRHLSSVAMDLLETPGSRRHLSLTRVLVDVGQRDNLLQQIRQRSATPSAAAYVLMFLVGRGDVEAEQLTDELWDSGFLRPEELIQAAWSARALNFLNEDRRPRLLRAAAPRRLADNFLASGEPREEELGDDWSSAALRLLADAWGVATPARLKVRLLLPEATGPAPSLIVNGIGQDAGLTQLARMTDPPAAWCGVVAAAAFSVEPNQETLAAALEALSGQRRQSWHFQLPWPLSALLDACKWNVTPELLAAVRDGSLGTPSDWSRAQQRWESEGMTLEDIRATLSASTPAGLGPSIGKSGIILAGQRWQLLAARSSGIPVSGLFAAWREASPSPSRHSVAKLLVRLISLGLTRADAEARHELALGLHEVVSGIGTVGDLPLYIPLAALSACVQALDDTQIDTMLAHASGSISGGPHDEADIRAVAEALRGTVQRRGPANYTAVLADLAQVMPLSPVLHPGALTSLAPEGWSAVAVALSVSGPSPSLAEAASRLIVGADGYFMELTDRVLSVSGASLGDRMNFALSLTPTAESNEFDRGRQDLLTRLVRERRSGLEDSTVCASMCLPNAVAAIASAPAG